LRRLRLSLRRRLSGGIWRWRGRLNDCTTRARLRDGLGRRNGLSTLASGDCDASRHDCGGGDAKTRTRDEIAAGNYWTGAFTTFSWFWPNGLGWLLTC
jgi:hypothetical protein